MEKQKELPLDILFPESRFLSYRIPEAIPADLAENIEEKFKKEGIPGHHWKNRDNVRHATYDLSGSRIAIFPSIPENFARVPYRAEAFSVFGCNSRFFTKRERFASYMLLYTYAGEGCLEYGGKKYFLKPGDGFWIDCRKEHFYYTVGNFWQHSVLHLQGEQMDAVYQTFEKCWGNLFSQGSQEHYQKNLQRLLKVYERPSMVREWMAADAISRLLTELLECPFEQERKMSKGEMMTAQAVGFMERYFTRSVSLEELSERVGVSKYYFSHEFSKYMGVPPMVYLAKLRIGHAKILLESTQLPVSRISEAAGIADLNHFYRQFKKYVGMTPGEYRRSRG